MKKLIIIITAVWINSIVVFAQNKIVFNSGEEMIGKVISISNNELIINFKGNELRFPIKDIGIIYFTEKNQQKITEKSTLSGVVTFEINKNGNVQPDAGAKIFINKIDNLAENSLENLVKKFTSAEVYFFLRSLYNKKDPKYSEYANELNGFGIKTQEDIDKLDTELSDKLNKRMSNEGVKTTTVDGSGKYSIQLEPGIYEIIIKSKGKTYTSRTEISGEVYVKNIEIKSNELMELGNNFSYY